MWISSFRVRDFPGVETESIYNLEKHAGKTVHGLSQRGGRPDGLGIPAAGARFKSGSVRRQLGFLRRRRHALSLFRSVSGTLLARNQQIRASGELGGSVRTCSGNANHELVGGSLRVERSKIHLR